MERRHGKEEQASAIRTSQKTGQYRIDTGRTQGHRQPSSRKGCEPFGINRTDWQENYTHPQRFSINGGIISQLIRQTEDRLAEAVSCIERYEVEKQKLEGYLEELKKLRDQEQDLLPENPSEES